MQKGFIFSIDAVLGIIAVVAAISAIAMVYSVNDSSDVIYEAVKGNAGDASIVGLYLDKDAADFGMGTGIGAGAEQGYCARQYTYDPDNGAIQPIPPYEEKIFCDES